jgi:hypothetical protein
VSFGTGRDLSAAIYDLLANDPCLGYFLDTKEAPLAHGSTALCDEHESYHVGRPIRREQQRWPSDFSRAIITFGRFARAPYSPGNRPWLENWTFVVSIFVQEQVVLDDGTNVGAGDLWMRDIYDHVVRVLGWNPGTPIGCGAPFRLLSRGHVGPAREENFNTDQRYWNLSTRFRWILVSRGIVAPVCVPCGTV